MSTFEVKKEDGIWNVTALEEVEYKGATYPEGCMVFRLEETTAGSKHDMELCLSALHSILQVPNLSEDDCCEFILANLYGDKYTPVAVYTTSDTVMTKACKMFKQVAQNDDIRAMGAEAVSEHPELTQYVLGAFVSSNPSLHNLQAIVDKMCKGGAKLNVDQRYLKAAFGLFTYLLRPQDWQMQADTDPAIAGKLRFNPNAAAGFKHFNIDIARNKRNNGPYMDEALKQILEQLKDYIGRSEDLIPPAVHNYTVKPEVREVGAELGKIRLIGMIGQLHDMISKIVDTPFMQGFQRWSGCMIGTSVWTSLSPFLMHAMREGDFNTYRPELREGLPVVVDPQADYFYIVLDVSGQDVSFKPVLLFLLLMFRHLYVETDDPVALELFDELFANETAQVNTKLVQWFGGLWYIVQGIMTSGYHGTSHVDCCMLVVNMLMALMMLLIPHGITPKQIADQTCIAVYGDDSVLRLPVAWAPYLGATPNGYPEHLGDKLATLGVELKPEETRCLFQTKKHKKKFFTMIKDDKIVPGYEGISFLQRYFVKYNKSGKPIHPDSKNYAKIMPWRKTTAYATRMATDANGFAGKEGRLNDQKVEPLVAAYSKAFGLLMDAGPNRVAHEVLRKFMSLIHAKDPMVGLKATVAVRGSLVETLRKLGPGSEDVCNIIGTIHEWGVDESYNYIVSKLHTPANWMECKYPEMYPASVLYVDSCFRQNPHILNKNVVYP